MQTLPQDVLAYIRKLVLLKTGDRVGVAVSGGADSVALLRLLLDLRGELGIVLSVVHFNHQLRGAESDEDERFVRELARHQELELHSESGNVATHAEEKHLSLETAAREMRYQFFRRLLLGGTVNRIATAHTLDDQAETVLLRIARGAGSRGLAGIYPQLTVSTQHSALSIQSAATIVRPLLSTRRKDLEAYLQGLGQNWREDSSNRDLRHARNRVRHGILPRMERHLNPAVREALAETAEIARAEENYWEQEVSRVLPADAKGVIKLAVLADLPLALQRRVVRAAAESVGLRLDFRHVERILGLASNAGGVKSVGLPDGWTVSRSKGELQFKTESPGAPELSYEYRLPVPGTVDAPAIKTRFEALLVSGKAAKEYNPEHLLDRAGLSGELCVRNWRAGDRFWPAHTKRLKKIKELLQERHVTGPERKLWPVVTSGTEVVWIRGFPVTASLRPKTGTEAVVIRETPQTKSKAKLGLT
ncbi:MAG: tRNA lysidine(34) synthetase TilS [Acidobacteriia bacterium]|nr:tRNA lysidine(34) synthetase TilS [Terriglobia bacterium]